MNRPRIVKLYNTRHNEYKRRLMQNIQKRSLRPSRLAILQRKNIQILDDHWNVTHNIRRIDDRFTSIIYTLSTGYIIEQVRLRWCDMKIWDISNDKPQEIYTNDNAQCVHQLSDGRIIIAKQFKVVLLNLQTMRDLLSPSMQQIESKDGRENQIKGFIELLDTKQVLSYSRDGRIWQWDLVDMTFMELIRYTSTMFSSGIRHVFELSNRRLAILIQGHINIFDMATNEETYDFYPENSVGPTYMTKLFGDFLAISDSEKVRILDVNSGQWLKTLQLTGLRQQYSPTELLQLSDGRLVVGCEYGEIYIWNFETDERIQLGNKDWHSKKITSLIETSDGGLISASNDNTVRYWMKDGDGWCESTIITNGTEVHEFHLPEDNVEFQTNIKNVLDDHLVRDIHGIVQDYVCK